MGKSMTKNSDKIIVYVTTNSTDEAAKIGKELVEKRLAACCSILPAIQSIYWWEDTISEDAEVLLMIKSLKSAESTIVKTVLSLHSYKVPEIISVDIQGGNAKYLQWIENNVIEG